jgi:hypothetical protein
VGGVEGVGAQERAEGEGGAVALRTRLVERGGEQLRPAQGGEAGDRVGERRVKRLGTVPQPLDAVFSPPPPRSSPSGRVVIGSGSARTSAGRTRCGASWPAGNRWMRVISAPDSVVGTAATRPPRTAAIAFAASITRPPPRATSDGVVTASMTAAEASVTGPAGTSWTSRARSASSTGAAASARGVVRSSNRSHSLSASASALSASSPARKRITRSPSCQVNSLSLKSPPSDSNREPRRYKRRALPVELGGQLAILGPVDTGPAANRA